MPMFKGLLLFLLLFVCTNSFCQIIESGMKFSGKGSQSAERCFIDKVGNRYQIVYSDSTFSIDSSGTPITIIVEPNAANSSFIIKYDINGNYLYHLKLRGYFYTLQLSFNNQNEVFLSYSFSQRDSIDLYHASKVFYKRVVPSYFRKANDRRKHLATILCKLNQNGQFLWVKTISRVSLPLFNYNFSEKSEQYSLVVNNLDEAKLSFYCFRPNGKTSQDTVIIQGSNLLFDTVLVSSTLNYFKFKDNGDFVSHFEPFKGKIDNTQLDTATRSLNIVSSDGKLTYMLISYLSTKIDTLKYFNPIYIEAGKNVILLKINENDSVLWAKVISNNSHVLLVNSFIDLDTIRKEVYIGIQHEKDINEIKITSFYNNNYRGGAYLLKLKENGDFVWDDYYKDVYISYLNWNHVSKKIFFLGYTYFDSSKFNLFLPPNPTNLLRYFFAYIKEDKTIFVSQLLANDLLRSNNTFIIFGSDINQNKGSNIIDNLGRTFISGSFNDSLSVSCFKLKANLDQSIFGTALSDGLVLQINPLIPTYYSACKSIVSPSGKYIWDSTGVYFDTIPKVNASCDSILVIDFKRLESITKKDTSVKVFMVSPSGKFRWDSTGTYADTLRSSSGCDSIFVFKLTVLQSKSAIDVTACRFYVSPSGKYVFKTSGLFKDTILNVAGADSIITLSLKILETTSSIDTANCLSYKSPSGRYEWHLSGNYMDTLTNSNGCDSIISIAYFQFTTSSNITITVCDSLLSPSKKYTYTAPGVYIDTIQNTTNCDSIITINLQVEPITLKLTKSNDISCDTPLSNLLAEGANSLLWSPITGLSNPNIYNPTANPEKSITYYVLAKNNIGCTAFDSIELLVNKVTKETKPINVFTPNGDGFNDCFLVQGIAEFESVEFTIYNRWGNTVYKSSNKNACWDGTSSKGENMLEGTYYYLLSGKNICGENIELHGSISLLR